MTFKRLFSITLSVILILSFSAGCKKQNTPTIDNTSSKQEEEKIVLSQSIEKTETEALYTLGKDIKADSSQVDVKISGKTAHIFFDMGDSAQVVSFSIYEDKVLGTNNIQGSDLAFGILNEEEYYVANLNTATLFTFSKDGTQKSETKICETSLVFGALDMAGLYFIYQEKGSNVIKRFDISSKEIKEGSEKISAQGATSTEKDNLFVKDVSGKNYSISFSEFTFSKTLVEGNRKYVDSMGITSEENYLTYTHLNGSSDKYMFEATAGEEIIAAQESGFITIPSKNKEYFRALYLDVGMATGQIEVGGIVLDAAFVGEDYVFVAAENRQTSENFYRLFNKNENQNKEIFEVSRLDDGEIYKKVFGSKDTEAEKQVNQATEKYKIRFLYGMVGKDFKTDYSYELADGVDVIPKLKMLEKIFDVLPTELLFEATSGREIWVYFCTNIDNKGKEYTSNAVLTELKNHKLILIDASCSDNRFAEALCHEFAHILDDYLPQSVKDGFGALTPDDIKAAAYTNDYTKISSDQYTAYDKDKSNVWFYNNYCRINEKEDRVITLGEMFKIYATQSSGENFTYENVKKKAAYLSKALEECFDYGKQYENQHWELAFPYSK